MVRRWSLVCFISCTERCHPWSETYEEMIEMLKDAVEGWLEVAGERGELEPNHKIVELAL